MEGRREESMGGWRGVEEKRAGRRWEKRREGRIGEERVEERV